MILYCQKVHLNSQNKRQFNRQKSSTLNAKKVVFEFYEMDPDHHYI